MTMQTHTTPEGNGDSTTDQAVTGVHKINTCSHTIYDDTKKYIYKYIHS